MNWLRRTGVRRIKLIMLSLLQRSPQINSHCVVLIFYTGSVFLFIPPWCRPCCAAMSNKSHGDSWEQSLGFFSLTWRSKKTVLTDPDGHSVYLQGRMLKFDTNLILVACFCGAVHLQQQLRVKTLTTCIIFSINHWCESGKTSFSSQV